MPAIAFLEMQKGDKSYYHKQLSGHNLFFSEEILDDGLLPRIKDVEILSVFVHSQITAEKIARLPKLKLIATRSAGFNHIDCGEAEKRGIKVSYVPAYGENTVAEHTFALILALSRNIHKAYHRAARQDFSLAGLQGFELKGKTIAVVGTGKIGLHVIKIARGFDMQVLAVDPYPNPFLAEVLQFTYVPLPEALRRADIISLHAPLNDSTHHLINSKNIALMKKGVIIINTARGELIDTASLLNALDDGTVAGAGVDVVEGEELFVEEEKLFDPEIPRDTLEAFFKSQKLISREDVVVTPHIGFNSREAVQRIRQTTVKNIQAYLAGHAINLVKAE